VGATLRRAAGALFAPLSLLRPRFAPLQLVVDKYILNRTSSRAEEEVDLMAEGAAWLLNCSNPGPLRPLMASLRMAPQFVHVAPFPQTAFKHNIVRGVGVMVTCAVLGLICLLGVCSQFYSIAKNVFAMFFVISFLFPASRLIRGLVVEKETKVGSTSHAARCGVVCGCVTLLCVCCTDSRGHEDDGLV
jgi:hypothetical protein